VGKGFNLKITPLVIIKKKQTYRAQGLDPVVNTIGYTVLQICQRHIPQLGLQRRKQLRAFLHDPDRAFVASEAHTHPSDYFSTKTYSRKTKSPGPAQISVFSINR